MNPGKQKRQFGGNFFDGSPKSLAIMLGGVVIILIILFIGYEALKPVGLTPQLTALAQSQQEITRVAAEANGQTNDSSTAFLAASVQASLTSEENQFVAYLANNGLSLPSKDLSLGQDKQTDQKLTLAEQASNFDPVFVQIMTSELQSYQNQLGSLFKQTKSQSLRALLQSDYQDVTLLLKQAQQ